MGVCASKPRGGGGGGRLNLRRKGRIRRRRRRAKAQSFSNNRLSKVEPSKSTDVSYSNPTFQGNAEAWYDPEAAIDSEGDEDFYSVQDDMSTVVTPKFCDQRHTLIDDPLTKSSEPSDNLEALPVKQVSADEGSCNQAASSVCRDGSSGRFTVETLLHNCGNQTDNCLPCRVCSGSRDGKMKLLGQRQATFKKRASFKLSFKHREGQSSSRSLLSPRDILQRPIAGSQISCCPPDKRTSGCWSNIAPNTFKVRGKNFVRDKKKECAPNYAAFNPFGADVFVSPRKIDHIARFVQLPSFESSGGIPPILVVNLQVPLYPASIFQNEYNGDGFSFVFYFKLSENYLNELPVQFQQNVKRIVDGEIERIKSFPLETNAPFRERLKILSRLVNIEDLNLTGAEKKLMNSYSEKPVLSRPQHEFYMGENYFEIDLDIHRFSYIARKGFESFRERIKNSVFDFGLTIQGSKAEDLPECILCCMRLNEIDYRNYNQLGL